MKFLEVKEAMLLGVSHTMKQGNLQTVARFGAPMTPDLAVAMGVAALLYRKAGEHTVSVDGYRRLDLDYTVDEPFAMAISLHASVRVPNSDLLTLADKATQWQLIKYKGILAVRWKAQLTCLPDSLLAWWMMYGNARLDIVFARQEVQPTLDLGEPQSAGTTAAEPSVVQPQVDPVGVPIPSPSNVAAVLDSLAMQMSDEDEDGDDDAEEGE